MLRTLVLTLTAATFLLTGAVGDAAVDPGALCKDAKLKATGKYGLGLRKAFGTNTKKPNSGKLTSDISKAQSKITKAFTKAEFTSGGVPRGCQTPDDVDTLAAKEDLHVQDVLDELNPPSCPTDGGDTACLAYFNGPPACFVCCFPNVNCSIQCGAAISLGCSSMAENAACAATINLVGCADECCP